MFFVSDIYTTAPCQFETKLQEKTYLTLNLLSIPFERVNTDEAITMDDCVQIDEKLNMKMVKTLFLCNRQQTAFYQPRVLIRLLLTVKILLLYMIL